MNKAQALYQFWAGFGIPAYDSNSVPDNAVMPYITYDSAQSSLDSVLSLSASLWYESYSWADIEAKATQIASVMNLARNPVALSQGGYMWIHSLPTFQRMGDPESDKIRRMYITYNAEFLTAY